VDLELFKAILAEGGGRKAGGRRQTAGSRRQEADDGQQEAVGSRRTAVAIRSLVSVAKGGPCLLPSAFCRPPRPSLLMNGIVITS
jgi:hypothetical protein